MGRRGVLLFAVIVAAASLIEKVVVEIRPMLAVTHPVVTGVLAWARLLALAAVAVYYGWQIERLSVRAARAERRIEFIHDTVAAERVLVGIELENIMNELNGLDGLDGLDEVMSPE